MSWTGRSEVGAEEESLMEILDSELVYFGAEYKKFSTNDSCSLVSSTRSTSSATATITSSRSCTAATAKAVVTNDGRSIKRQRKGVSANSLGSIKVRKDKLGDKISALHQLVSPFGKSDTASVLYEALGYIGFLHDQVQALCSPYLLQRLPTTTTGIRLQLQDGECEDHSVVGGGVPSDLRSRGLCLVPIACTGEAANDNGADFWPCAMGCNGLYCSKH